MAWDQLLEPGVSVRSSDAESRRFGVSFDRVTVGPGRVDHGELARTIASRTADVLVVRYDAADLALAPVLASGSRTVLAAGALTYWEKPVCPEGSAAGDLRVLAATDVPADVAEQAVRSTVRLSFEGYGNHYSANPLLDPLLALAGYEEWALQALTDDAQDVLLLADGAEVIGVATVEPGAGHLEILLAGMVPARQGSGLYGQLLAGCERWAASRGLERMIISTQVHNVRVQRAWARFGLRPFAAVETVHLVDRALLDRLA